MYNLLWITVNWHSQHLISVYIGFYVTSNVVTWMFFALFAINIIYVCYRDGFLVFVWITLCTFYRYVSIKLRAMGFGSSSDFLITTCVWWLSVYYKGTKQISVLPQVSIVTLISDNEIMLFKCQFTLNPSNLKCCNHIFYGNILATKAASVFFTVNFTILFLQRTFSKESYLRLNKNIYFTKHFPVCGSQSSDRAIGSCTAHTVPYVVHFSPCNNPHHSPVMVQMQTKSSYEIQTCADILENLTMVYFWLKHRMSLPQLMTIHSTWQKKKCRNWKLLKIRYRVVEYFLHRGCCLDGSHTYKLGIWTLTQYYLTKLTKKRQATATTWMLCRSRQKTRINFFTFCGLCWLHLNNMSFVRYVR